jgi:hypothetical protein
MLIFFFKSIPVSMSATPAPNPLAQFANTVLQLVFWPATLVGLPVPQVSELGVAELSAAAEEVAVEQARGAAGTAGGGRAAAGGFGGGGRGGVGGAPGQRATGTGPFGLPGLPSLQELMGGGDSGGGGASGGGGVAAGGDSGGGGTAPGTGTSTMAVRPITSTTFS